MTSAQLNSREVRTVDRVLGILIAPLTIPLASLHHVFKGALRVVDALYNFVAEYGQDKPLEWYVRVTKLPRDGKRSSARSEATGDKD